MIDGCWVHADDGSVLAVTNPATDSVVAQVPRCGGDETDHAIDAASKAFPAWRARTAGERAAILDKLAGLMRRDSDRLAALMTAEQGKPIAESKGEIAYAASFLDWSAEEAKRMYGETIPASAPNKRILVLREPVGVCGIITPWNFPSAMITRKLGPALASGCTVVIKPAEETPLSAIALGELAIEAGVPNGIVNIVTGDPREIGGRIMSDRRVRKLSFTGSTEIGRLLMKQASGNLLRLSLELGGHAPFIVFDDADVDAAIKAAVACKFRNAGQTCVCANRFYVQSGVYDAFMSGFADAVRELKVGVGTDNGVTIGPLINDDAIVKVERQVADAREKGAKILAGGERASVDGGTGRFYQPTLIDGMTEEMLIHAEETFGPVAPVRRFEHEDEAIRWANDSDYGLAAYFFTSNASRLIRVAERLEYGIIGANDGGPSTAQAPFGGIKQSGFGREGGKYAIEEYTQLKYVSWGV